MKQINHKNSEEAKNENSLKLLGKKTIRFRVKKKSDSKEKSTSQNNPVEGRWSFSEQKKFIKALSKNGPNWKKIQEVINLRTLSQIRSHGQKFFKRLKRCKNKELGIDFTNNTIRSFKDMIEHIKSVNINYDINNVFLYLYGYNQISIDELKETGFFNKEKINISNTNSNIFKKDNNKFDLCNINNMLLLDSLININNNLNAFIVNYLNKSIMIINLINKLFLNYLENINNALSKVAQTPIINTGDSLNNSNIDEIENNKN